MYWQSIASSGPSRWDNREYISVCYQSHFQSPLSLVANLFVMIKCAGDASAIKYQSAYEQRASMAGDTMASGQWMSTLVCSVSDK